ncbi:polysaccharide biosynthesis/export family protein [Mucilaginibacter gilvus]|uniref:Polysaccharide export protein n=1 Tax=Mucilaginibacter gilvus TaxID=2305909 RepID=A0A3S3UQ62_9SPHI|nr:polysaccharide biosynthesis/export family protein [Mucilaginibacter gilvus]RWY48120.1 polysaccharide export protein [Mucilaginibacter gilvus]
MKLKHSFTFFAAVLILFNFSCTSYKNIPYLQDLNRDSISREKISNYTPLTIQNGDLLGIHFISLSLEASAMFNYNLERPYGPTGNLTGSEENAVVGYFVDDDGNISLPLYGKIKATGMTTTAFGHLLEEKLASVLTKPSINVRIQNFKVSVIGDVKLPNSYTMVNERATILDALSLAGDLNITGIRKITLIREIDGERIYVPLNLQSKDIFKSPYFYLKKNDVIYVTPNEQRAANDGSTFQRAGLIVSVLSIIAILLTR